MAGRIYQTFDIVVLDLTSNVAFKTRKHFQMAG